MIRVALTQRALETEWGERRDALEQSWSAMLEAWGMTPIPVGGGICHPEPILDDLAPDVLVLTGGGDLSTIPGATDPSPGRDRLETQLVEWARTRTVPVVGVCRGMQFLAEHHGARLGPVEGHIGVRHAVTWMASAFGGSGRHEVNSSHRYGVDASALSDGVTVLALDDGGHVEALWSETDRHAAVMWHPEREPAEAWGASMFRVIVHSLATQHAVL